VESNTPGTSFPETSELQPVIMFAKNNNSIKFADDRELATFPTLPNLVSVENDATLAKSATAVGYAHKRKIEQCTKCARIMVVAVKQLVEVISLQLQRLQDAADRCKSMTKATEAHIHFFTRFNEANRVLLDSIAVPPDADASLTELCRQLEEIQAEEAEGFLRLQGQLTDLGPAVNQLHKRYSSEGHLIKEWGEVTRDLADISTAATRATTYVVKLKESWQHLLRDRASRTHTYNDEQFHILEKIKMTETIRVLVSVLVAECTPSVTSRTEALADWYKMASTIYLQTEILYKDLSVYQDDIAALSLGLRHSQERYLQVLREVAGRVREAGRAPEAPPPAPAPVVPPCDSRNVRKAVKSILGTQDEVWGLLRENSRLIEQFTSLAAAAGPLDNTDQLLQQINMLNLGPLDTGHPTDL
jgi:TANK-binding kinase 1